MKALYLITSLGLIALYAAAAFNGWEAGTPKREKVDPSARSHSGSRYYGVGYRGGK